MLLFSLNETTHGRLLTKFRNVFSVAIKKIWVKFDSINILILLKLRKNLKKILKIIFSVSPTLIKLLFHLKYKTVNNIFLFISFFSAVIHQIVIKTLLTDC